MSSSLVRHPTCLVLMLMCAPLVLANCASSPTKKFSRKNPFTKPAELEKISSQTLPATVLQDKGLTVEQWDLVGPMPERIGMIQAALQPGDVWHEALGAGVAQSGNDEAMATEAMQCAAREHGHFKLLQGEAPSPSLADFIRRRCGSLSNHVYTEMWTFDLDPGEVLEVEKINPDTFTQLRERVAEWVKGDRLTEIGISFEQREGLAFVTLAMGQPNVFIEPIPMIPPQGEAVTIKGRVLIPSNSLSAMITEGEFGYAHCALDSTVQLPSFSMACPINVSDGRVVLSLGNNREGSIFSSQIFDQMLWPAGLIVEDYAASSTRQVLRGVDVTSLEGGARYLAYVNAVRAKAGLGALTLSEQQSLAASALTPHMFQALSEDDDDSANKIALGLLAGWDVGGEIIDGTFRSQSASDGQILSLIDGALESPSGRRTLLNEEADVFAVGERSEGENIGAMLLVYDFLPQETYIRRVARAWRTINQSRKLQKKTPLKRSAKLLKESEQLSAQVQEGKLSFEEASQRLAQAYSAEHGRTGVHIYYNFTHDINDFELHPDLLSVQNAEAMVMVIPLKPEGYPWTIYAITILTPQKRVMASL